MIEEADLGNAATMQRLVQEADVLGEKELADILDELAQDDGSDPELSAHLQVGLWDYLEVTGASQQSEFEGRVAAPPANDACASPTLISAVPYANTVPSLEATDDTNVNPSCDSSSNGAMANNGIWYSYTPAVNCSAQLSEGSSIDTAMSVWTGGTCATLAQSFCTDPESGTMAMVGGTTYYILVSTWSATNPTANYTFASLIGLVAGTFLFQRKAAGTN